MAYVWNTPTSQNILQGLQGFLPSSPQTPSVTTANPMELPVGQSPTTNFSLGMNGYAQGTTPFQYNAGTAPTFTGLQDVQGLSDNVLGASDTPFVEYLIANARGSGLHYGVGNPDVAIDTGTGSGAGTPPPTPGFFSWDRAMGTEGQAGWVPTAFQGLQAGGSVYGEIQKAKAAKNLLNFQKKAYRQNFNQQAQTLNTAMRDRQAARRSYSSEYQDVDSYMKQNELKSI